jgi:hypothetical protein
VQFETRPRSVLVDLRTCPAKVVGVAPGHGYEAGESNFAVPSGELRFTPRGGFLDLPLAGGLGLPEAAAQLAVGLVTGDRGFDLPG